ncbi:hypothetical protein BD626DRAFT_520608, partial [Schizophyllum amplum]
PPSRTSPAWTNKRSATSSASSSAPRKGASPFSRISPPHTPPQSHGQRARRHPLQPPQPGAPYGRLRLALCVGLHAEVSQRARLAALRLAGLEPVERGGVHAGRDAGEEAAERPARRDVGCGGRDNEGDVASPDAGAAGEREAFQDRGSGRDCAELGLAAARYAGEQLEHDIRCDQPGSKISEDHTHP